jgi:predicted O-methyltransferase YrrM
MQDWLAKLFDFPAFARMGHLQRVGDLNLGLGWIYYGLARVVRPKKVVVIGSYRGFVPLVLGKALADNLDGGQVIFIDPSFVDDFWKDAEAVREHFARFDVTNVQHFLMTTQQFARSEAYRALDTVGMVFVDGYHSEEQARFDYETFEGLLGHDGIALFHDTARSRLSGIYGAERAYRYTVTTFIDQLRQDRRLQVFDLPFGQGVTLVRKVGAIEKAVSKLQASSSDASPRPIPQP